MVRFRTRRAAIPHFPTGNRQHIEALAAHHRQLEIMGGELPGEFRKPRRAGGRRDRTHRRPRA